MLRRGLIAAAVLLVVLLAAASVFIAALDAGHFHGLLIGYVERQTARKIVVAGAFHFHVLSRRPELTAEHVTIGNPRWTPAGITAEIGKLQVTFNLPGSGRSGIDGLKIEDATLHLFRDAQGRANWQRYDPQGGVNKGLPLIRHLWLPNAHVILEDQRRHLQFDGNMSIGDAEDAAKGAAPLLMSGSGQLNGKAATFELRGEPLVSVALERPYHFTFSERASGSHLNGAGLLPQPFDFRMVDASFEAAGPDLKDLYFLTGVTLVNTGSYRLSGKFQRRADHTEFGELEVASGETDVRGSVETDASGGRSKLTASLTSQVLHVADFGLRAAGRDNEPPAAQPMLMPDTVINLQAMPRSDAVVRFQARRVDVGRFAVRNLAVELVIDRGILTASPVSAEVLGGKLSARIKTDATQAVPLTEIDLSITDLQLAQLNRKAGDPAAGGPAPIEGPLQVRLKIAGRGNSIHQVAASADGTATLRLPQGTIRTSLAELTGIDLRGLGLMLEKNKKEAVVRCGVADFSARQGDFTVERMLLDTEPVLISGAGQIHMQTEALQLTIHGEPKSMRILRLEAPVLVGGSLARPSIGIRQHDSKLVLVDRGRARDADCSALVK
jgi:AsmA family protein